MIRLIRAPLETASSAMAAKRVVGIGSVPRSTTSSSGPSDPASAAVGTTIEAVKVTSR